MSLLAIIGVAVLVISTIGFGATLTTTPGINRIGGSDDNVVDSARGNVTSLAWTEEVDTDGNVAAKEIKFTVWNEDASEDHTFQVCAVLQADGSFQPTAGEAAACVTTSNIAALDSETNLGINFTNVVKINDIEDLSFSIEELN